MKLQKENVVKIATTERDIERLKRDGFKEIELSEQGEDAALEGDNSEGNAEIGQGAGTPAPSSASTDSAPVERDTIKARLDALGVEYAPNASTKTLKKMLDEHGAKGDET